MKTHSADLHRKPPVGRSESTQPSRAPIQADGPDKALEQAGAMGNQAFLRRVRDSAVPTAPAQPAAPSQSPAAAVQPHVDEITIVDSSAGAIGGFANIIGLADLGRPGPLNDPVTGEVSNVHQVHLHLDEGSSADLKVRREVKRTVRRGGVTENKPVDIPAQPGQPAQPGGLAGNRLEPDGPIEAHEVQRPDSSRLVVADAPGAANLFEGDIPFHYQGFFTLTASRPDGADVAQVIYYVGIEKNDLNETTNAENTVLPIQKRDLIRGKPLP